MLMSDVRSAIDELWNDWKRYLKKESVSKVWNKIKTKFADFRINPPDDDCALMILMSYADAASDSHFALGLWAIVKHKKHDI
jgi:hypothetical protein